MPLGASYHHNPKSKIDHSRGLFEGEYTKRASAGDHPCHLSTRGSGGLVMVIHSLIYIGISSNFLSGVRNVSLLVEVLKVDGDQSHMIAAACRQVRRHVSIPRIPGRLGKSRHFPRDGDLDYVKRIYVSD